MLVLNIKTVFEFPGCFSCFNHYFCSKIIIINGEITVCLIFIFFVVLSCVLSIFDNSCFFPMKFVFLAVAFIFSSIISLLSQVCWWYILSSESQFTVFGFVFCNVLPVCRLSLLAVKLIVPNVGGCSKSVMSSVREQWALYNIPPCLI